MTDIESSWKRICDWYTTNVPTREIVLNPSAEEAAIVHFEETLCLKLPDDVRDMYRLHDGTAESGVFPYGYDMSSLEQVQKDWECWRDRVRGGAFDGMKGHPDGPIKSDWWNSKWIPITSNGCGDHDCIDLDPDDGGEPGQFIEFNHETGARRVSASSFGAWLSQFADGLIGGEYRYDEEELNLLPVDD